MGARLDPLLGATAVSSATDEPASPPPATASIAADLIRRAHLRDAVLVATVTLAAWMLCGLFNVTEMLRRLTGPYERYQFDELPSVLLVLGVGLTWFATRRYAEAQQEIARRKSAEAQLAAALADNRRLAQQYVALKERERKTLARELHDELGQYLNVIKLDAVGIRDDHHALPAAALYRASTIVENCNHIHGALATLIRELRPTGLDELGLAAALEHCVETWRARLPGVSLQLSIAGEFAALPESITVTLYRLVQEALTNVAKHADAQRVAIRLVRVRSDRPADDRIRVSVVDDGLGAAPGLPTRGLGLIGMRERVMALQGELEITSSPGHGFELFAQIPVSLATGEVP